MDKIQELHGKVYLKDSEIMDAIRDHATITEDMMGKFAEWAEKQGYSYYSGSGKWRRSPEAFTTSELINLFKQTL